MKSCFIHLATNLLILVIITSGFFACSNEPASRLLETTHEPSVTHPKEPVIAETSTPLPEESTTPPTSESPASSDNEAETPQTVNFKLVGYITHWHLGRLSSVKIEGLTHLIWQGIEVTSGKDPTLHVSNSAGWWQIDEVVNIGHANGAKVLVSLVGHWNESDLTEVWTSPEQRMELIDNLKELVESYNLDGIDIDNENMACDKNVYSTFIKELFNTLSPIGKIITMAGSPYKICINPDVFPYIDFVNLMTYDMAYGQGYPYHSTLDESIWAINFWADSGMPTGKLVLGIPCYGRDGGVDFYEYWWLVKKYNPSPEQNEVSESNATGGIIWWNGPELVKEKVNYIEENNFGGIMLYELGTDSQDGNSLLVSVYEALKRRIELPGTGVADRQ